MPNPVHLILTPSDELGLGLAVGEAHRRYTNFVNARARWTGHLFQSRFASVAIQGPPVGRRPLCAHEPRPSPAGGAAGGLALVQRAGPPRRNGPRPGGREPAPAPHRRFRRAPHPEGGSGRLQRASRRRDHRPAARQCGVHRRSGAHPGPKACPRPPRPEAGIRRLTISTAAVGIGIVSPYSHQPNLNCCSAS
jgi:hypothetical protein